MRSQIGDDYSKVSYDFLPKEDLINKASELKEQYLSNAPFPHIVIDNLFDEHILNSILDEFPSPKEKKWQEFDNPKEIKLATNGEKNIPPITRQFLYNLNSETFLNFLSELTGIQHLISDPYFEGGGLHQIKRGGKLSIHADFNKHSRLDLDRRLNVIIYLNKNWKEEYGGHIELWNTDMSSCREKVLPVFNRMVVFSTTSDSYHGHPDELKCPEGMTRKSLALYYYTNGRPEDEKNETHTTIFRGRPDEKFEENFRQKSRKKLPKFIRKYIKH